jgi:hypothetical protein
VIKTKTHLQNCGAGVDQDALVIDENLDLFGCRGWGLGAVGPAGLCQASRRTRRVQNPHQGNAQHPNLGRQI